MLDVGCGFGATTRQIARQVGPSGTATGVDCAPNFVNAATREAREGGVANASFFATETDDLRGPYDFLSRFGTIFFKRQSLRFATCARLCVPAESWR